MSNEPRPAPLERDPAEDVEWIQVASDVPDVGTADSKESFFEWCRERHAGLQRLRQRMGNRGEGVAVHSFRYPPAIASQCWHLWTVLGGGADIPKSIGISADEIDAFLERAAPWHNYRRPTHHIFRYMEEVEEFLTGAMAWCNIGKATAPGCITIKTSPVPDTTSKTETNGETPPSASPESIKPPEQIDPRANAIALMIKWSKEGRKYTIPQLAEVVGTSKATLYRDTQFQAARSAIRTVNKAPKGSKDSHGNMEAYDDD